MKRSALRHRRTGSVLIVALVCLGFATTVLFGALRIGLQQRRQLRVDHSTSQVQWLLDAGLRLAMAKTSRDASYSGQTLSVDEGLRPGQTGEIKITVDRDVEAKQAKVTVAATLSQQPGTGKKIPLLKRSYVFTTPTK